MAEEGRHDACEEDMEFPSQVQSYGEFVKRKRPTMKIARLNWASLKKKIQTPEQKVESFWGVKQWLFTNRSSILQVEKCSDESRLGENQAKACKGY